MKNVILQQNQLFYLFMVQCCWGKKEKENLIAIYDNYLKTELFVGH